MFDHHYLTKRYIMLLHVHVMFSLITIILDILRNSPESIVLWLPLLAVHYYLMDCQHKM